VSNVTDGLILGFGCGLSAEVVLGEGLGGISMANACGGEVEGSRNRYDFNGCGRGVVYKGDLDVLVEVVVVSPSVACLACQPAALLCSHVILSVPACVRLLVLLLTNCKHTHSCTLLSNVVNCDTFCCLLGLSACLACQLAASLACQSASVLCSQIL